MQLEEEQEIQGTQVQKIKLKETKPRDRQENGIARETRTGTIGSGQSKKILAAIIGLGNVELVSCSPAVIGGERAGDSCWSVGR